MAELGAEVEQTWAAEAVRGWQQVGGMGEGPAPGFAVCPGKCASLMVSKLTGDDDHVNWCDQKGHYLVGWISCAVLWEYTKSFGKTWLYPHAGLW